jgi:hypothetical protein
MAEFLKQPKMSFVFFSYTKLGTGIGRGVGINGRGKEVVKEGEHGAHTLYTCM